MGKGVCAESKCCHPSGCKPSDGEEADASKATSFCSIISTTEGPTLLTIGVSRVDSHHKSTSGNRFSGGSDSSNCNAVFIKVHFFTSMVLMETEDFPVITDGDEPRGNNFFK